MYLSHRNFRFILTVGISCLVVVSLAYDDEDSFTSRLNETLFSHNSNNNLNNQVKVPSFPRYDNRPARPRGAEMSERNLMSAVNRNRQRNRDGCATKIKIINGVTVFRRRGSIVKFICSHGFSLLGATIAVCLSSRWSEPPPICVKAGCTSVRQPLNGGAMFHMDGAVVSFHCNWNYELVGNAVLYCDGSRWNGTEPTCNPIYEETITTSTTHNPNADWDYVTESGHYTSDLPEMTSLSSTEGEGEASWDENVQLATATTTLSPEYSSSTSTPIISHTESSTAENVSEMTDDKFTESMNPSSPALTSSTQDQNAWDNSISIYGNQQSTGFVSTSTEQEQTEESTTGTSRVHVTPEELSPTTELSVEVSTEGDTPLTEAESTPSAAVDPLTSPIPAVVRVTAPTTLRPRLPPRRNKGPPRPTPSNRTSDSGSSMRRPRPRPTRPTRRPIVLRPRTRSWTISYRTTKKMTSPIPESNDISTSNNFIAVTMSPNVETQFYTTTTNSEPKHQYFDQGIPYNSNPGPEFIQPISPHKLDLDFSAGHESIHSYHSVTIHISMVGGILLAVISIFLIGGVAMYCWRKNKGIARARHDDIDGRTLSASDAMEDFTWMEAREYRH